MGKTRDIAVVVNISLKDLTAHPIFCLQLSHHLASFGRVTLFIPGNDQKVDTEALSQEMGFPIDFEIQTVKDRVLGKRSLRFFFYLAVIRLWLGGKNLLWAFEPYSVRLATRLGIAGVVEIHSSLPPARYIKTCLKLQRSSLFKLFISNSQAHSRLLVSKGFRQDKMFGAHNAIGEHWLTADHHIDDKPAFWSRFEIRESFVVTYAGSLYKGRGVELMLAVATRLPDVAFVILGGPDAERIALQEQTDAHNVYFLGQVPHKNVRSYMAASDILVALYDYDCEDIGGNKTILTASPMKLFEYMASGVPVITSNLGAIPEIIEHGVTGMLINPGDVQAFMASINKLRENRNLRCDMGNAARTSVAGYTWPERLNKAFNYVEEAEG